MAQCATTALAGAVPCPCVRRARGQFEGLGPVPGVVSLPFPPSRPACPALRVAGRPVRVSLTLACWYAIPRGLCVPRARSGCPSGSPRVPLACVCACAPVASAPPPPGWCGVRTFARSRHWALVGPFHVVRAPPRVLHRSPAPSGVLGGGGPVPAPPYLAWPARTVGAACRGGGAGPSPGGGVACHCCEGHLVSGAVPPPTAVLWGGQPGYRDPCVPGAVCVGVGTQHRFDSLHPCGPALLAVGWRKGVPGGGAFHRCEGRLRSGAPPPPTARPLGGLLGSATHVL